MNAHNRSVTFSRTVVIGIDGLVESVENVHVLEENTFKHAVNYIMDNHLDLFVFDGRFNDDSTGAPAYDPSIMANAGTGVE